MLTHESLKNLFLYDPETGVFCRKQAEGRPTKNLCVGTPDKDGYLRVSISGKRYSLHRLAFFYMTGHEPQQNIDHINGQRADNRWANLREATHRQNSQNRQKQIKNKRLPLGVFQEARGFRARIRVNGKRVHLGSFKTAEEASEAYQRAKQQHHNF